MATSSVKPRKETSWTGELGQPRDTNFAKALKPAEKRERNLQKNWLSRSP